jgi:Ni2+-binding GTPase involved in maturation of urease and hydrogenase
VSDFPYRFSEDIVRTKLVLLEGFLGSGKTMLMLALGRRFASLGLKTSYITNNLGVYLVDTLFARGQSSATAEVMGSCFCCNFPALADHIAGLQKAYEPDLVIAVAVGSCTELAATVVLPIQEGRGRTSHMEVPALVEGEGQGLALDLVG